MKVEVVVTDVSQCKKDLAVEVAAEEVKKEYDKAYDAYVRYVKVPGFRPGRVPRGVVKQRFSKEVKEEVIGQLLPHALQHVVVDHKLKVVGDPQINDITVAEGEAMKFKASIEVLPDFELKEFKGLKATKRVMRITDEDVDKVIERWRENAAEFVPIEDRPSQKGDFVSINLVGKYVEPKETYEQEDLTAEDVQIELGSENVQPEFDENLMGVQAGDVREFRVNYPEDYDSKGLAGKAVDFTATVVAVREKELPELDDEFAKDNGDYLSLQDMRDKVREMLVSRAESEATSKLHDEVLDRLLEENDFDVPDSLIEKRASDRVREFAYSLMQMGLPPQATEGINWHQRIIEAREQAKRDVRAALLVSRIGEAEGISISQEEIDGEIEKMANDSGEELEELKARLTSDEAVSSIESRLRYRKSLEFIINNAEVAVEEITEDTKAETEQANPEAQVAAE